MSKARPRQKGGNTFPLSSVMTLAFWRLRRTWFLLLVTTFGMVAAVVVVCAIPLLSDVMTTAGLRSTLSATPTSAELELNVGTLALSTRVRQNVHDQFTKLFQQTLGTQLEPGQSMLITQDVSFAPVRPSTSLTIFGTSMQQAAAHVDSLQGRIAQKTATPTRDIEIMLTPETAKLIGVQLGSKLQLSFNYAFQVPTSSGNNPLPPTQSQIVTAHVVGLFNVDAANAVYWHGNNFTSMFFQENKAKQYFYSILMPDDALMTIFDAVSLSHHLDATFSTGYGYTLLWYYHLDTPHLAVSKLDGLIDQFTLLQNTFNSYYGDLGNTGAFDASPPFPYLIRAQMLSPMLSSTSTPSNLERFRSRVDVTRIPVAVLAIQIIALILFFVSLMVNLLVDRQAETVAVLRSRGASSGQVFGALLAQSVGLGILSLVIGLPLAVVIVLMLAQRLLPKSEQMAVNIITNNPVQVLENSLVYAGSILLVTILTMSVSLFFAARMDVLSLRRESARSSKRPLWQRLNLDVAAGVIALVGYGLSVYLASINATLQGDAQTLIATPLSIIAPFFLVIGCMFLFLRIFPLLLRLAAYLASRGQGAVSLLALAQIARSPRQSVRMTLLLALATSFGLFSLVYTATEFQHIQDIAIYQIGADFGGDLPYAATTAYVPTQVKQKFQTIPGVISTSVGYTVEGEVGTAALQTQIRAVDATNFGDVVLWPSQQDAQAAKGLLRKLVSQRSDVVLNDAVPAVVDTSTLHALLLHIGSTFTVKLDNTVLPNMHFIIVGTVLHIPTINDRTTPNGDQGFLSTGGMLVDYQSFVNVYANDAKHIKNLLGPSTPPSVNHIWLHTRQDATSLSSIRTTLNQPVYHLDNLADRQALLSALTTDPLYLVLAGILNIGTIIVLLLALLGDLLASWLNARTRQTNFAVLRALGTTPQQVASVLTWEQAIVYVTGLLLGIGFGALISATVVPALTFTDLNVDLSTGQFYALQSAIPTPVVIPPTLPLALLVLAIIFVIALAMMVRTVSQPSLSQTLRLNED